MVDVRESRFQVAPTCDSSVAMLLPFDGKPVSFDA